MDKLTDFQNEILQAAKASFDDLKHSFSKEHFYGYCLYTDSSAMTVMPAANSEEGLQGTLKEMEVTDDSEIPEFKWAIAEWKYEAWKSNNFKLISQKLRTSQDRSDIASFAKKLQSDMLIALKKLDEDGYFGNSTEREKITLFISISDCNDSFVVENESAKILNPTSVYTAFINRYEL